MNIDFSMIQHSFVHKPLLIGGMAMEYYGLRKSGDDIDCMVSQQDYEQLMRTYPHALKNLWGDLGVVVDSFELWKTIHYLDYEVMCTNAIEEDTYLVISLEKLLLQKSLVMEIPKYHKDLQLLAAKLKDNYGRHYEEICQQNKVLLGTLQDFTYLEYQGEEQ